MNDEAGLPARPATTSITAGESTPASGRCGPCGGWISRRCPLCRGCPDEGVEVEDLARWRRSVDIATSRVAA